MRVALDESERDDMGGTNLTTRPAQVLDAAHRCVDLLVRTAVIGADDAPTWSPEQDPSRGRGLRTVSSPRSFQDGDAGVVWALTHLGAALNRPDAAELAASGAGALLRSRPAEGQAPGGLFSGEAGVDLLGRGRRPTPDRPGTSDLADGLAGVLLSMALVRRAEDHAAAVVAELWRRSRVEPQGRSWPVAATGPERSASGVSRGPLGIAWALAEAAAVWPALAPSALDLAAEALDREAGSGGGISRSSGSDSSDVDGFADPDAEGVDEMGGPDVRSGRARQPGPWCDGPAGDAAVRLRLLELAAGGLEVPWSVEVTRQEADAAVRRCRRAVDAATGSLVDGGPGAVAGGWTLASGLGAPAGALALAADVLGRTDLRDQALEAAGEYVARAPADPAFWPSGHPGAAGDVGLAHGVAGTAVLLADLALPGSVPSVVLLGAGGTRGTHRRSGAASARPEQSVVRHMRVV